MQSALVPARAMLAAGALLLIAGCAQPPAESASSQQKRPPSDHWEIGPSHKVAVLTALDHKAVLVLDCGDNDDDLTSLIVVPERRPAADKGRRAVTITLDREIVLTQSWYSGSKGGYGTGNHDPGFMTLMNALRKHQVVQFALHRSETDVDEHSFTLNGAKAAIDEVLAACKVS